MYDDDDDDDDDYDNTVSMYVMWCIELNIKISHLIINISPEMARINHFCHKNLKLI